MKSLLFFLSFCFCLNASETQITKYYDSAGLQRCDWKALFIERISEIYEQHEKEKCKLFADIMRRLDSPEVERQLGYFMQHKDDFHFGFITPFHDPREDCAIMIYPYLRSGLENDLSEALKIKQMGFISINAAFIYDDYLCAIGTERRKAYEDQDLKEFIAVFAMVFGGAEDKVAWKLKRKCLSPQERMYLACGIPLPLNKN